MTSTPQFSKSFALRVARLAPPERAMSTIMASNGDAAFSPTHKSSKLNLNMMFLLSFKTH